MMEKQGRGSIQNKVWKSLNIPRTHLRHVRWGDPVVPRHSPASGLPGALMSP